MAAERLLAVSGCSPWALSFTVEWSEPLVGGGSLDSLVPDPRARRLLNSAELTLVDRPRTFWCPTALPPADRGGLSSSLWWGWLLPDRSLEVEPSSLSRRPLRMLKLFRGGTGEPAGEWMWT